MKERGGGSVLAVAAMAVVIAATLAVVAATQIVTGRARAITAADAAALAAAVHTFPPAGEGLPPHRAALAIAAANEARLASCLCPIDPSLRPRTVEVKVETSVDVIVLGRLLVTAASRAEYIP